MREHDGGLPGVRAIGVKLATRGVAQVSTNVQDPFTVPLADVVEAVRRAGRAAGARRSSRRSWSAWRPAAALDGFPADVELRGFDERRHVLENRMPAVRAV